MRQIQKWCVIHMLQIVSQNYTLLFGFVKNHTLEELPVLANNNSFQHPKFHYISFFKGCQECCSLSHTYCVWIGDCKKKRNKEEALSLRRHLSWFCDSAGAGAAGSHKRTEIHTQAKHTLTPQNYRSTDSSPTCSLMPALCRSSKASCSWCSVHPIYHSAESLLQSLLCTEQTNCLWQF